MDTTVHQRTSGRTVTIDGGQLTIDEVVAVARQGVMVRLSEDPGVLNRVEASRRFIEDAVAGERRIYGVTTGFGGMSHISIPKEDASSLQHNMPWFLKCGAGSRLPLADVRAAMLLRANTLIQGLSGIRLEIIHRLVVFLNSEVTPEVRELGSIGASGDLVPLAAIAGCLIGLSPAFKLDVAGERLDAPTALERLGLKPMTLAPKEGLAIMNGTSVMAGIAANCVYDNRVLLALAMGAHALILQGLAVKDGAFHPFIHDHKPHPGQRWSAERVRALLAGSKLTRDETPPFSPNHGEDLVQERYSVRCLPQYMGPIVDGLATIAGQIEVEMNSVTDNPLIDAARGESHHCGNFLGQYAGIAMDQLRFYIGMTAKHLDVQIATLVAPEFNNGLPPSLVGNQSRRVNMGLKGLQLTGNSIMPHLLHLGAPFVNHYPTYAEQFNQNINSLGFGSANLTRKATDMFRHYLSVALMFGVQAVDLRTYMVTGHYDARACLSPATVALYEAIREGVGRPPSAQRPYIFNDDEQALDEHIGHIEEDIAAEGPIPRSLDKTLISLKEHRDLGRS